MLYIYTTSETLKLRVSTTFMQAMKEVADIERSIVNRILVL